MSEVYVSVPKSRYTAFVMDRLEATNIEVSSVVMRYRAVRVPPQMDAADIS